MTCGRIRTDRELFVAVIVQIHLFCQRFLSNIINIIEKIIILNDNDENDYNVCLAEPVLEPNLVIAKKKYLQYFSIELLGSTIQHKSRLLATDTISAFFFF